MASRSGVATRGTTLASYPSRIDDLASAKDGKHDEIIPQNPLRVFVIVTGVMLVAYETAEIPGASPPSWKLLGGEQTCSIICIAHDRNLLVILHRNSGFFPKFLHWRASHNLPYDLLKRKGVKD